MFRQIILISLFTLTAFPSGVQADKPEQITVCLPYARSEFLSLVALEALDQGFFKKQGMEPKIRYMTRPPGTSSAPDRIDRMVASEVALKPAVCTFGSSNVDRYIYGPRIMERTSPLLVATYGLGYDTHLVVNKNSPIKSVKDLKGKRLRVGQLPTYLGALGALEQAGIGLSEVNLVGDFEGVEKAQALARGDIDALAAYLPFMAYLLASDQVRIVAPNIVRNHVAELVPHSLMIVNSAYAKANPVVITKFMKAMQESYEYIMRNPSEVVLILARHSEAMAGAKWTTTKTVAEKAATFVGKVLVHDLRASGPASDRASVNCNIRRYNQVLIKKGVVKTEASFASWLNLPAAAQDCATRSSAVLAD